MANSKIHVTRIGKFEMLLILSYFGIEDQSVAMIYL